MQQFLFAQWLALSLVPLGCFHGPDFPEVNGRAVITVDGEEFELDTGNDGEDVVPRDDREWNVDCSFIGDVTHLELADHQKNREGFYYLSLYLLDSKRDGGDAAVVNMRLYVDNELLAGSCPATARMTQTAAHESVVSFAACNLRRLDRKPNDVPARLEFARFRLRSCRAARDD